MYISRKSPITQEQRTINVPCNPEDYFAWEAGLGAADELMPYLTQEHRDFIVGGVFPGEFEFAVRYETV